MLYFIVVRERRIAAYVHIHFSDFCIDFVPIPDHDFLFLANRTSDCVSGSSKVALPTPFIALTFYVLTLQIINVLSLSQSDNITECNTWMVF